MVDGYAQKNATLTTIGVGLSGNYNDVLLEVLANRGNGTYHYMADRTASDRHRSCTYHRDYMAPAPDGFPDRFLEESVAGIGSRDCDETPASRWSSTRRWLEVALHRSYFIGYDRTGTVAGRLPRTTVRPVRTGPGGALITHTARGGARSRHSPASEDCPPCTNCACLMTWATGVATDRPSVDSARTEERDGSNYNAWLDVSLHGRPDGFGSVPGRERIFTETARDARIQVEFNPEVVRKYRLIGYENRAVADEDFRDDSLDFGEVGFARDVSALYELRLFDDVATDAWIAQARLRWLDPMTRDATELSQTIRVSDTANELSGTDPYFRQTAAAAEFAELLRKSFYAQCGDLGAVDNLLGTVESDLEENRTYRELRGLVDQAERLFEPFCKQ